MNLSLQWLKNSLVDFFRVAPGRLRYVDGLRAISIFLVMIGHVKFFFSLQGVMGSGTPSRVLGPIKGDYGVDVFFTISGILIGSIVFSALRKGTFSFRGFYTRRFLRLAPAYYATLLVLLLLPKHPLLTNQHDNYLYNFLYLSNFPPLLGQFMGWSWSLSIEEQFYLAFPALAAVLVRTKRAWVPWLVVVWAGAGVAWLFVLLAIQGLAPSDTRPEGVQTFANHIYASTMYRSSGICCGLLVACAMVFEDSFFARVTRRVIGFRNVLVIISSIVLAGTFLPISILPTLGSSSIAYCGVSHVMVSAAVAAMALSMHFGKARALKGFLSARFFSPFAKLSYSLYLLHPIVFVMLTELFVQRAFARTDRSIWSLVGLSVAASVGSAMLMYLFIEKPVLDLRGTARDSSKPAPPAVPMPEPR